MAGAATAVAERPARSAVGKRRRPKWWVVLVLTWGTLAVLVLVAAFTGILPIGTRNQVREAIGVKPDASEKVAAAEGETRSKQTDDAEAQWRKEFDRAMNDHDYARAQTVCQKAIDGKGDAEWKNRLAEVEKRKAGDALNRSARLKVILNQCDTYAVKDHRYDEAIKLLGGISADDRAFLASRGVDVVDKESRLAADQRKWQELKNFLARADSLRQAKKPDEALKALKDIKANYPEEALKAAAPSIDQDIQALETQLAAGRPPVIKPPVVVPEPVKPPLPPKEMTPETASRIVADLKGQADVYEKIEKLPQALAQLEQIQTRVDKKYWPDGLEEQIRLLKKKIQALEFFLGNPAPKPKTP
jgi:tetratricopeptide (TPR) repeat protein